MQSQPFIIDRLVEYRTSDLYTAALDVRSARYSGRVNLPDLLLARLTALVGRRARAQAKPSATSTRVRPAVQ